MKNLKFCLSYSVLLLWTLVAVSLSAFGQITPSQDSYTNTASATTNYGTAATLGVASSTTSIQTTYIKFDLSAIPSGYTSSNVAKATLKLYVSSVAHAGSFNVDYVNGSWTENTITSSLPPSLGTTIASSVPLSTANVNDYALIDVTPAIGEWLSGSQPNDGIALVANGGLAATFDSKENATQSHPAELDIVFTGGGTISGVTTSSGSGLTGGGTSGTLNLSLQACSTKQVLQWNGGAWACASTGTGSVNNVALSAPSSDFTVTGSPVTGTGTLNLAWNVPPSSADNGNALVKRDANGDFAASTINAINVDATNVNATYFFGNGVGLSNVNATKLGGRAAAAFATQSGSNTFSKQQAFLGNGLYMYTGDPGCGAGFAGIGFGQLSGCNNFAITGSITDLFLNRPAGGTMHLGENNTDEVTILPGGQVGIGTQSPNFAQFEVDAPPNTFSQTAFDGAHFIGGATTQGGDGGSGVYGLGGDADGGTVGVGTDAGAGVVAVAGNSLMATGANGVDAYGGAGNTGGGDGILAVGGSGTGADTKGGDGISAVGGNDFNGIGGGYAGEFRGDVAVYGQVSKSGGSFKIDHPLDPANKYLYHSFVESPDMMNIYNGLVSLDGKGEASVELPEWFEALNRDFRYQLTAVGAPGPNLYIAEEIANNHFQIAGGKAGLKVSWQVTGIRQDVWANVHRIPVEEDKTDRERGYYIHPELFGAPQEKGIEWARHPDRMRRVKEIRAKQLADRQRPQQTTAIPGMHGSAAVPVKPALRPSHIQP